MKVVLLAGGYGTRISEESELKPKPMIEVGGRPILWHIMKHYSHYGHTEFIILCGYKGYVIKEYFANYFLHQSDVTFNLANGEMVVHNNTSEDWKVTLVETGLNTYTGGRIKRAEKYIGNESFLLTYGDGLSNVNLDELLAFHKDHGKIMTLTSVQPDGKFGSIDFLDNNQVSKFLEKPIGDGSWINGGFFVCEPNVLDYIKDGDATIFERSPMEEMVKDGELFSFKHNGFWKCMDTLRDKNLLCEMWDKGSAEWKLWE